MNQSKKISLYILVIAVSFLIGAMFLLIKRDWLIVKFSLNTKSSAFNSTSAQNNKVFRKNLRLYFWKEDKFDFEEVVLVWLSDDSENIKHLVNSWLVFLKEERITTKKTSLDSVCLDRSGQKVFLSFNQKILEEDWSIYYKWRTIESLLKTIGYANSSIREIVFLVNHQIMRDDHIDFSQNWPIEGFIQ